MQTKINVQFKNEASWLKDYSINNIYDSLDH